MCLITKYEIYTNIPTPQNDLYPWLDGFLDYVTIAVGTSV